MNLQAQVQFLRETFGKMETFPMDAYDRLSALLDKAPAEALEILVREKVKFCGALAVNRLVRKFGYSVERIQALRG